jgi:transcription antitermination factor NusG
MAAMRTGRENLEEYAPMPLDWLQPHWYAAYTCAQHEKRVREHLEQRSIEAFLPLYETVHRWKDRRMRLSLALFPGYVFVRLALRDRLQVLQVPGVARLVGFNGQPAALRDEEIEGMRSCLVHGLRLKPHPYLGTGQCVRISSGPFQGLEGIVQRKKGRLRFIISLNLILRSVEVEINETDLEPFSRHSHPPC